MMNSPDLTKNFDIKKEALEAEKRIRKHIRETPLEHSPYLSQSGSCKVYLKLENLQLSGSFKLRGVMNILLSLPEQERDIGLVTASSGNHGAAFAYALNKLGLRGTIYMPSIANEAKIEGLRYYDTDLKFHGTDCVETEIFARNAAEKSNLVYIPPYNDLKIIGGQATVGIELQRQIEHINTVIVPVGGGGLISGIAAYLKSMDNNIEIIGCQPVNSAVMYESIKAGKILEMESKPTLADASAGGIEKGTITFDICKKYVDDFILVTEEEIREGIKLFIEKHNLLIEGTGVLPAASYLKTIEKFKNKNVVLILSGARIGLGQLKEVLG
jgi:threonine dehydratase